MEYGDQMSAPHRVSSKTLSCESNDITQKKASFKADHHDLNPNEGENGFIA
jgi:hypothetical protein